MAQNTIEKVKERVWKNSLETCEYCSGYENYQSTINVRCTIHDIFFSTRYENVRRDNKAHHICPKCQEEDRQSEQIECTCDFCGKKFFRPASKVSRGKSGLNFCNRECKDNAQRIESGERFEEMRPDHYDNGNGVHYRAAAFRTYEHCCAVCGWGEDEDILEVHHIDENRSNNKVDNLIILCPLCHRKLSSHKYSLIGRIAIIKN